MLSPRNTVVKSFVVASLLAANLFAVSADAAGLNQVKAVLASPASQSNLVAAEALWSCDGNVCTTMMDRKTAQARDCRQLAKLVGKIESYSVGASSLDEAGLAACNKSAS